MCIRDSLIHYQNRVVLVETAGKRIVVRRSGRAGDHLIGGAGDKLLIPWENVLIYRDFDRCRRWTMEGGFARMYPLQARCV